MYFPQEHAIVSVGSFFRIGCLQTGQFLRHIADIASKKAHPQKLRVGSRRKSFQG
jgi:hypothetical protein